MPNPSEEQQEIINHNPDRHGRVLAGPGTGKSFTAVSMLRNIAQQQDDVEARMVTFTRAATQELAQRLEEEEGLELPPPSTVHALALGILMSNPDVARLPRPIRIPSKYESRQIRRDIARRLREHGYQFQEKDVLPTHVKKLEQEMSSGWESLDEELVLLTEIENRLRGAYTTLWEAHRSVLGYTLLAEIPFRAGRALEDHDIDVDSPDLILVDEYQDLNRADIQFLDQLAERGTRILAIGDDDQSIYSFRMAAPEGIRQFPEEFGTDDTYDLTQCFRCGEEILEAANSLIQASADPERTEPLEAAVDYTGKYEYARFPGHRAEARGVADMIQARIQQGISPEEIIVLVRSSVDDWISVLGPELEEQGIEYVNPDSVDRILSDENFLCKIEKLHIAAQENGMDSLAWWILLDIVNGISDDFRNYIYQEAIKAGETFAEALLRVYPDFEGTPTTRSANTARDTIEEVTVRAEELRDEAEDPELDETGWGGWILEQFGRQSFRQSEINLLEEVGKFVGKEVSLRDFLGKLEPVAKDLATDAEAVRIMTMTKSKGLTVNSVFVMGVEEDIIPMSDSPMPDEERRLLYVAMTRATHLCVLTYANRRRGRTARHGGGETRSSRGRSSLLEHLEIGEWREGNRVVEEVQQLR